MDEVDKLTAIKDKVREIDFLALIHQTMDECAVYDCRPTIKRSMLLMGNMLGIQQCIKWAGELRRKED